MALSLPAVLMDAVILCDNFEGQKKDFANGVWNLMKLIVFEIDWRARVENIIFPQDAKVMKAVSALDLNFIFMQ